MDAMGVDQALLFPTLFAEYLPQVTDIHAAAVLAQAYNDWLWDLCQQGHGRLHPVAIVAMGSPDLAVAELEPCPPKGSARSCSDPPSTSSTTLWSHTAGR